MYLLLSLLLMFGRIPSPTEINYETARQDRKLKAVRISDKIDIDGRLDESAWAAAPIVSGFIQNEPHPNEPASEQTEVRMLYDSRNVYFGLFMHDSRPSGIVINELKKDFGTNAGDAIEIILDTFHDERNGYLFATNAAGAKYDAQMINEEREINSSWDGIWHVKTSRTDAGWIAEISIPLKTLKFRSADVQTWGINIHRNLRSNGRNEDSYWSPLPRIYNVSRVSLAGRVEELEDIKPGVNLKIKPYVRGSLGKTGEEPYDEDGDFGVDVKYGLTSGITWDFTYNTDFSQVEADQQQINLTRFDLFFPEKRDFFLENSGIFQFGPGGAPMSGMMDTDLILFFSRRIGLSDSGAPIPIYGGTRLTGRASGWELGFLDMQQEAYEGTGSTNFAVGRVRRNILSNSDVGVMMTNKEEAGPHFNRTFGADANFRFGQAVTLNGYAVKSFSPLEGKDRDNMAARASFEYKDRTYNLRASFLDIQENFTDEMGFVPRKGIRKFTGYPEYAWRPESVSKWIRSMSPHVHFDYILNADGKTDTRQINYHYAFRFQDGAFLEPGYETRLELIPVAFTISNAKQIQVPIGWYKNDEYFILGMTDNSRRISGNGRYGLGKFYGGYRHSYEVGASFRASYKMNASVNYAHDNISLPQPDGHFKNNLLALRLDYSFSTTVFLNALVQYNSDAREWNSNIRFNIIHHPLSDLFLVYNERRDSVSGNLVDRAVILKLTYMLAR